MLGRREHRECLEAFGAIDATALREIRNVFVAMEPLVASATLDDLIDPRTLAVELSDGVGTADTARFDVRWSVNGCYAFPHTDKLERNFRFDRHPKPDAPTRHFYRSPDTPSHPIEPSCITVSKLPLVTRAVLQRWRDAYEYETLDAVNDGRNPL